MRVLWFSSAVPDYVRQQDAHYGGGWMQSLVEPLCQEGGISLGIAYEGNGKWGAKYNNVTNYPIACFCRHINKLKRKWNTSAEEHLILQEMQRIIKDFQPDIIHVWGTESAYGLISGQTSIPCVIHLQGLLAPCYNAKYPPGISRKDFLSYYCWQPRKLFRFLTFDRVMRYRTEREERILRINKNYLGRTEWDKSVVQLHNPEARYFYNSEMLRTSFMQAHGQWIRQERKERKIISVISMPYYKGHDLILKTAKILKKFSQIPFSWEVYGVYSMDIWKRLLGINHGEVSVKLCGTATAERLCQALLDSDVFVHPSYIDNSPNSLCEAQLLGLPVIATYTGGVPSLVKNNETGILVPTNAPYMLAEQIQGVLTKPELAEHLGKTASACAEKRHDPKTIIRDLLSTYRTLAYK